MKIENETGRNLGAIVRNQGEALSITLVDLDDVIPVERLVFNITDDNARRDGSRLEPEGATNRQHKLD